MRVVVQRVSSAAVHIGGNLKASIGVGMLILLGIEEADTAEDVDWLCARLARLRIFPDENGVMNVDVMNSGGGLLVVSQFTLHASTRKGNRPSYIRAARPETAVPLYEQFVRSLRKESGIDVQTGEFGAMMQVELVNDGPVTILIDSRNRE
ncbi:MAG: D-aminoacyl-tRNA deacylase [Bacteroidales bacterium]|nr:D-aminoacyl-tRNA deacylase [Bacteroidales bacterium]